MKRELGVLFLAACATAPKGPAPAGAWAREVPVAVDEQVTGRDADPLKQFETRKAFIERLTQAGVRIVPPGTAGAIPVQLVVFGEGPNGQDAPGYHGEGDS